MKDFLCYSDSTFDFGESGVALLSGPSGAGKTSILRGIFFALFGEGNKLQACGSTSCRVELEFDGIKIIRTKRPNRLIVNDVHEDESGQCFIDKIFGETFKISGYIQQNNLNSFILMSPVEKLAFLEKFAFRDVDLGKIKGRCKAYITQTSDALVGVGSQLEMAKKVLEEMEIPNEKTFPLKCKKSEREKAIKNEKIRLKNCETLISRSIRASKSISQEILDTRVLEATLKARSEALSDLETTLLTIDNEISNLVYDGDDSLASLETSLTEIIALRDIKTIEKQIKVDSERLRDMKKDEEFLMNKRLKECIDSEWKEYSKEELNSTLEDLKKCLDDATKIQSLKDDIKNLGNISSEKHYSNKKDLESKENDLETKESLHDKLLTQQSSYSCPSCSVKVRLVNDELILSSIVDTDVIEADLDTLNDEICKLKKDISKLQKIVRDEENKIERMISMKTEIDKILSSYEEFPSLEEVKGDLEYLRGYQASQFELEKRKKDIERDIKDEKFSSSYFTFKKGIEKMENKLSSLRGKVSKNIPVADEEELRELINSQKHKRDSLNSTKKRRDDIIEAVGNCKKVLENTSAKHIKDYGAVKSSKELERNYTSEQEKLRDLEIKKRIHENNLKGVEEWERYQDSLENYRGWENKVEELEAEEKIAIKEHASATKLKDKILEAESMAMLNIIESINSHARVYLDCFFPTEPISVNLQTFKETKKSTKPQINIEIEYKGMESDLNMLSGGELSRVILAYTMALAEMFNTPLLLLDECTASLDQELSEVVFSAIRENFNGKMTLLIAHQVVTGSFDKIIRLNSNDKTAL
jgi:exonuclease SbcC